MHISKILNNNAVVAVNEDQELILIGGGIGWGKKIGEPVDQNKIERFFVDQDNVKSDRFVELISQIPVEFATLADDIIKLAKSKISTPLSHALYISLMDHINSLVTLAKQNISVTNQLSWEIKKYYPLEYRIGQVAVNMIELSCDVSLDETEAGNIAMHLINAQTGVSDNTFINYQEMTKKIHDIVMIVRLNNKIEIDETSLAYDRFVTHLRFFFKRLENGNLSESSNPLLVTVVEKYPKAYETTKQIESYLDEVLYDDEQLYLTLHIQKLIEQK